jgi:predicted XRE-type DNA-binding protein
VPKKPNKPQHITKGNVFDDLGFPPDEAAALKVKAIILTEILSDYQPNVSNLLNGKISKMSIEKLLSYATRLNMDARISVKAKARSSRQRVA